MKKRDKMKAVNFDEIHFQKLENHKIKLSTVCQIVDDSNNPIKNSILVSSILNNELECFTDENGYTKIISIQDEETPLLSSSKEEIQSLFKILFNTSLVIKETRQEKQELQNFPLGTADFENIINKNKLYIDKTKQIYKLIQTSEACFISRPRRFGKSLVVSTLEALFKGQNELFNGLDIEKENYSFEEYPVLRLDLSSPSVSSKEELKELIHEKLLRNTKKYGFSKPIKNYSSFLEDFSNHTNKKIVILVDEYDKPVLDNITKENVNDISNELASFFGATKSADKFVEFLFITGITKLSNVNMFSDANHITDMSTDKDFDAMFGYTQEELENRFNPYIKNLAIEESLSVEETLLKIKEYYNGYTFSESERPMYNPYSILNLFQKNNFKNYWFESGTPAFVLELMKEKGFDISDKNALTYGEDLFDKVKSSELTIKNILFQAGYLTVKKNKEGEKELIFPNTEVRDSFYKYFITFFAKKGLNYSVHLKNIKNAFISKNPKQIKEVLNDYFADFTYETTGSEKLYHSLIFALLNLTGFNVISEVLTKKGRIDQYLENGDDIYIIEYKYKHSAKKAMEQIIDRKYFQKYLNTDKNIYLLGINFEKDGEIKDDILIINPRDKKELESFINRNNK
ncbi:MAG: hypothetical protein COB02_16865 [Candidatus Cloacimonadota bacterium]|nr:MAG: hypothetical protein COB02_16865 [Candidatus Cloacimonadota bacterium]